MNLLMLALYMSSCKLIHGIGVQDRGGCVRNLCVCVCVSSLFSFSLVWNYFWKNEGRILDHLFLNVQPFQLFVFTAVKCIVYKWKSGVKCSIKCSQKTVEIISLDGDDHDFFNCCILSTIKKSPGVLSAEGSPRECLVSVIF